MSMIYRRSNYNQFGKILSLPSRNFRKQLSDNKKNIPVNDLGTSATKMANTTARCKGLINWIHPKPLHLVEPQHGRSETEV